MNWVIIGLSNDLCLCETNLNQSAKIENKWENVCKFLAILFRPHCVNSCGTDTRIFRESYVSTNAADALASRVVKASVAMI